MNKTPPEPEELHECKYSKEEMMKLKDNATLEPKECQHEWMVKEWGLLCDRCGQTRDLPRKEPDNSVGVEAEQLFELIYDVILKDADKQSRIWFGDTSRNIMKALLEKYEIKRKGGEGK